MLADISGYNAFVAGTEFDHAQEIIHDLLEYLVDRLRPILTLVQIESDAIFAYIPGDKLLRGETLFELIENSYFAFKDQLTSVRRHQTCQCAACQNVNGLDLKFFVHYGEYIEQSIEDHHGLLGLAPMLVRKREWKGPVAESTGWHGYALFTRESLANLNLSPQGLEAVEMSAGPVQTYGLNLQARYEKMLDTRQVVVSPEMAHASLTFRFDAHPPVVWEWLNDPGRRNQWWESFTRWTQRVRPDGRTGPGAINHCDHGIGDTLETVLDWRPFEYFTVEMRVTPGGFIVMQTVNLQAVPQDGTQMLMYLHLQNPRLRWMAIPFCKFLAWFHSLEMRRLNRILINNEPSG